MECFSFPERTLGQRTDQVMTNTNNVLNSHFNSTNLNQLFSLILQLTSPAVAVI